jgi:RNA recognition motif-containing protein
MKNKKLFVGNLTYSVRDGQLRALFSRYGEVVSVHVIEKKGYGFVEMRTPEQAENARSALKETEFEGRNLLIDGIRPPLKSNRKMTGSGTGGQVRRTYPKSGNKAGQAVSGYRGKKSSPKYGQRSGNPGQRFRSGSSMPPRRNTDRGSRR